jgi:uracil-DNA glycosylase
MNSITLFENLPIDWQQKMADTLMQPAISNLAHFVDEAYASKRCFPPKDMIFHAFKNCAFDAVKIIIIGQDPYHGFGQANGLAFSVNDGLKFPPSLVNIFKEIESDLGLPIPLTGNLERWASQGVLLLNTTLTVEEGVAGSHQNKGWETFTDSVITLLSKEREGLVFMLWGGYAQKKGIKIDASKHLILRSGHPSPLSANKGHWFGNKHFSQSNTFLKNNGLAPIVWE